MGWINDFARAIVLVWMATASVGAWAAGGYLYDAAGSVSVAIGKNPPRPVVKNEAVASGTVIRTGDKSSAVLKFEDGQVVSMQANTTFQVRNYIYEPKKTEASSIVFTMFKGGMRFITGEIGKHNKNAFRLVTPNTTIGIRGTEFLLAMVNNATYGQVISGSISLANAAGVTILTAGQTALVSSVTTPATMVPASSVPAGTFSQITAIPVPAATPAPVPAPASAAVPTGATATTATTATTAGGAATGGAATATTAGTVTDGISATTIGIGIGIAAGVVALTHSTTTTHH